MSLEIIGVTFGIILKVFSAYFFVISLFAILPFKPCEKRRPKTSFACLIAARNEEAVIANLVRSLKEQEYPEELCDIYVIPNNCSDNTEKVAREAGAYILHTLGPVHSKGEALHDAIIQLRGLNHDAYLVFDADNVLNKTYLRSMNDAFLSGADAVKSQIQCKNPYDSWVAGCYGLYFNIFNVFFNRARANIGLSAKLIGTGMGVSRRLIDEMGGWNAETIAEDTEFNTDCALKKVKVFWVPDAITYDEAPNSFSLSLTQRKRWASGIMDVGKLKAKSVLKEMIFNPNRYILDAALILLSPFLQALSLVPGIIVLAGAAVSGVEQSAFIYYLAFAIASYAGMCLFALLLSKLAHLCLKACVNSILLFPVFMTSWTFLCLLSCFKRTKSWKEIRHTGKAKLSMAK